MFLFSGISSLYINLKGRRPNLCQLDAYARPMSTLIEPNQMVLAILIDQLQQGNAGSVSRNIVHLIFVRLCLRQAQQYLIPHGGFCLLLELHQEGLAQKAY